MKLNTILTGKIQKYFLLFFISIKILFFASDSIQSAIVNGGDQVSAGNITDLVFQTDHTYSLSVNDQITLGPTTTTVLNQGILALLGNNVVTGNVGSNLLRLKEMSSATTVGNDNNLLGDLFVRNFSLSGSGVTLFGGHFTGTTLNFNNDTSLTVADNKNISATAITATTTNQGTMTFSGTSDVTGTIGTSAKKINTINAGTAGKTTTFNQNIFATTTNLSGLAGTINLNGSLNGTILHYLGDGTINLADNKNIMAKITTSVTNQGILNFQGTSEVNGEIGINGGPILKAVNLNGAGKTVSFYDHLYTTTFHFGADATAVIASGKDINGTITTSGAGTGSLTFGGNVTTKGAIGSSGLPLKNVTFSSGGISNLNYGLYAQNITNTAGAINFSADTTLGLADGGTLTGTITTGVNNEGTLDLLGDGTIPGQIGDSVKKLKQINAVNSVAGKSNTFSGDLYATNMSVMSASSVLLNGNYTGTALNFAADGTVTVASGKSISANVTTGTIHNGSLIFGGNLSGTGGDMGTPALPLRGVTFFAGGTSQLLHNLYALNITNTGGFINFAADTTIGLSDTGALSGSITTGTTNQGTLTLVGDGTVSGSVGTSGKALNVVNAGVAGKTANFSSNIHATTTNVTGTGTVNLNGHLNEITSTGRTLHYAENGTINLADNKNIYATITASANNRGQLNLAGTNTIYGQIGNTTEWINAIFAGVTNKIANFNNDVYATTLNVLGDGLVNMDGNLVGNSLSYAQNGTLRIADDKDLTLATGVVTAVNNQGTLTLSGTTTVSSPVGTTNEKLETVNAGATSKTATFSDNVFATNFNVSGDGNVLFNGNYEGSTLNFAGDGAITMASGMDLGAGAVTTSNNKGSVTFLGETTTLGSMGTSGAVLKNVTFFNGAGTSSIGGTFDLYATTITKNAGTINFNGVSTIGLGDGGLLTGTITTSAGNQGTLTLIGTGTVANEVGTAGNKLSVVNAGVTNKTATFDNNVYATIFNVTGNGNVLMKGNLAGTTLNYNDDGVLTLSDGKNISNTITTSNNKGTLTLLGTHTMSNQVGTDGDKLKVINGGVTGEIVTFSNDTYSTNFNITGTGIANLNGNYKGTTLNFNDNGTVNVAATKNINAHITTTGPLTGNLTFADDITTLGNIGSNFFPLHTVTFFAGGTSHLDFDLYSLNIANTGGTINFNSNKIIGLGDDGSLTGTITTSAGDQGILTLLGKGTVANQVGDGVNKLSAVNAGVTSKTATFNNDVYATTFNVTGAGNVLMQGHLTGTTLNYAGDGNFTLSNNKNITGAITSGAVGERGTLTFTGSSNVSGSIGTLTNKIKTLNAGADSSSSTLSGDAYIGTTNITGTGILSFDGNLTGTSLNFANDGFVNIANGKTINANVVVSAAGNTGTLRFLGDVTTNADLGTSGAELKAVLFDGGGVSSIANDIYAKNITGSILNFTQDKTITISDSGLINSIIRANSDNRGAITFVEDGTLTGQVGTINNKLKTLTAGADTKNVTLNGEIYATGMSVSGTGSIELNGNYTGTALNFNGDGVVRVAATKNINADVTTTTPLRGTLVYLGDVTTMGKIGSVTHALSDVDFFANGTSHISDDFYARGITNTGGIINFSANKIIGLAEGGTLTGNLTTSTDDTGTLIVLGEGTVENGVGLAGDPLKEIKAGATNKTATFNGDLFATTMTVNGAGDVVLNGSFDGTTFHYAADGSVTVADTKNITAAITSASNQTGSLTFVGDATTAKKIGTSSEGLREVIFNSGGGGTGVSNLAEDLYAKDITNTDGIVNGTINFNADKILGLGHEGTLTGDLATTAGAGTGTLTLLGSGTVNGQIGTTGAPTTLLQVNAGADLSSSTFNGHIFANNFNFTGSGTVIISDGSSIEGNVITDNGGQGVLTFGGISTVTGDVGTLNEKLNTINAGADSKTVNFNGDIFSNNLNFSGDGEMTIADDKNLTAAVTTATDGEGALTFSGTTMVVGDIGTSTEKLRLVSGGVTGEVLTLSDNVYATKTNFTGDGTIVVDDTKKIEGAITTTDNNGILTFDGNAMTYGAIGTSDDALRIINFNGIGTSDINADLYTYNLNNISGKTNYLSDKVIGIAHTGIMASTLITSSDNTGTLTFLGDGTLSKQVGEDGMKIARVNAGVTVAGIDLNENVYAHQLNFSGNGVVNIANTKNLYGDITTTNDNQGQLNFGGDVTTAGSIGSYNNGTLKALNSVTFNGIGTTNIAHDLYTYLLTNTAGTTQFSSDKIIGIGDGGDLATALTTATNNWGTLAFMGDATLSNPVGASLFKLKEINGGVATKTVLINENVYTHDFKFSGDGEVIVNNLKYIYGDISTATNKTGNLVYVGDTDTQGNIGSSPLFLKSLTFNGAGTSQIAHDIYTFNVTSLSNSLNFSTDKTLTLGDSATLDQDFTTTTGNQGTITFVGNGTSNGQIGDGTEALKAINGGADSKTVTFNGNIFARITTVTGNGQMDFNGNVSGDASGSILHFANGGKAVMANNTDLTAAVTTSTNHSGRLTLLGTTTVLGNIGTSGLQLEVVSAGALGEVATFDGDLYADALEFGGDGTVVINNGKILSAPTTTTVNQTGTLNFGGNMTTANTIGALALQLKEVLFNAGGTSHIEHNLYARNITNTGGTINFSKDTTLGLGNGGTLIGTVTTTTDQTGTIDVLGNGDLTNTIGTSSKKIGRIKAGVTGTTVNLNDDVYAHQLNFEGDGNIVLADNKNLTAVTTTNTNNKGSLLINGTSIINGSIGTVDKKIKSLSVANSGEVVTMNDPVYATNISVAGTGTVHFNGDTRGENLNFASDGVVNVAAGKILGMGVTTTIDSIGSINTLGNTTISDNWGSDAASLKEINFNQGGLINLGGNLFADSIVFSTGSELSLNGDRSITGDARFLGNMSLDRNRLTIYGDSIFDLNEIRTTIYGLGVNDLGQIITQGNISAFGGDSLIDQLTIIPTSEVIVLNGSTFKVLKSGTNGININDLNVRNYNTMVDWNASIDSEQDIILTASRRGTYNQVAQITTLGGEKMGQLLESYIYQNPNGEILRLLGSFDNLNAREIGENLNRMTPTQLNGTFVTSTRLIERAPLNVISTRLKNLAPATNEAFKDKYIIADTSTTGTSGISSGSENEPFNIKAWAQVLGGNAQQNQYNSYDGYKLSSRGFLFGVDQRIHNHLLGIGFSLGRTKIDHENNKNGDKVDIKHKQFILYSSHQWLGSKIFLEWMGSYALLNFDSKRNAGFGLTARSDHGGSSYAFQMETGWNGSFFKDRALYRPSIQGTFSHFKEEAYEEVNAGVLNQRIAESQSNSLKVGPGLSLIFPHLFHLGLDFTPEVHGYYLYDFINDPYKMKGSVVMGAPMIEMDGVNPPRASTILGASLSAQNTHQVNYTLRYDLELRKQFIGHSGSFKVSVDF